MAEFAESKRAIDREHLIGQFVRQLKLSSADRESLGIARRAYERLVNSEGVDIGSSAQTASLLMGSVIKAIAVVTKRRAITEQGLNRLQLVTQLSVAYRDRFKALAQEQHARKGFTVQLKWPDDADIQQLANLEVNDGPVSADRARDEAEANGSLRVGAMPWAPFVERSARAGHAQLWKRFVHDVIRSVYPKAERLEATYYGSTADALDHLRNGETYLVFGIYMTGVRARRGFDLLAVPGLVAPVGVVSVSLRNTVAKEDRLDWHQVFAGFETRSSAPLRAIALQDEVGHSLLADCGYRRVSAVQTNHDERSPQFVVVASREFAKVSTSEREQIEKLEHQCDECLALLESDPSQFVCAGWQVCLALQSRLTKLRASGSTSAFWLEADLVGMDYDDVLTPRFQLGLAVANESHGFRQVIEQGIHLDMYGAALPRSCRWYCDVLSEYHRLEFETDSDAVDRAIANATTGLLATIWRIAQDPTKRVHDGATLREAIEAAAPLLANLQGVSTEIEVFAVLHESLHRSTARETAQNCAETLLSIVTPLRTGGRVTALGEYMNTSYEFRSSTRRVLFDSLAAFPRYFRLEDVAEKTLRQRMWRVLTELALDGATSSGVASGRHAEGDGTRFRAWTLLRTLRDISVPPW